MWLVYRRGIIETSKTRHFNWKYFLSLWLLPTTTFYICKNTPVTVILRRSYPVFTTTKKEKVIEPRGAYVIRYASHNHKHIHTFTVTIFVLSPSNFGCDPTEKKNAACNRQNLLINDNLRLFFLPGVLISHKSIHVFIFFARRRVFWPLETWRPRTLNEWQLDCSHVTISAAAQCSQVTERFPAKKWERHHGVPWSFPPYTGS